MVSSRSCIAPFLAVVVLAAVVAAGGLDRRDGSTITVSTTQFNPAITNQGGTTNAAGTFNVSPLATSTSYQFQTLSQTSTFVIGPVNTQSPSNNGGSSGGSGSGNGGGSGSGGSGNVGGGTVVVTATAPTSTVQMGGSTSSSASGTGSAASSGPSLALGATNGVARMASSNQAILVTSAAMVLLATVYGAFVIA